MINIKRTNIGIQLHHFVRISHYDSLLVYLGRTMSHHDSQACQVNFTFIGHSEHFQQDIQVTQSLKVESTLTVGIQILAKELNIPISLFPSDYKSVNGHAAQPTKETETLDLYFERIKSENLRKLKNIYSDDYIGQGHILCEP